MNKLWDARLSKKALEKIGAGIGADVPFCVRGGTAAARGAGDNLSVLPCPSKVWWVLGISGASLSTVDVYEEFDRLGGGKVEDPYDVADALARADVERLAGSIRNAEVTSTGLVELPDGMEDLSREIDRLGVDQDHSDHAGLADAPEW